MQTLTRIWVLLGAVGAFVTLLVFLRTVSISFIFADHGRPSAAIFGVIVALPCLYLLVYVSESYRRACGANGWSDRIPAPFGTDNPLHKQTQAFLLALFLLVPAAAQVHFLITIGRAAIYDRVEKRICCDGIVENLVCFSNPVLIITDNNRYRIHSQASMFDKERGFSFIPGWELWAFLLLILGLWCCILRFLLRLRAGDRKLLELVETVPADLEIRVTLKSEKGKTVLAYVLHSPNGAAPFQYTEYRSHPLNQPPQEYHLHFWQQIEKFHTGEDAENQQLLHEEIQEELEDIGRQLYRRLFPKAMRDAYRRFRHVNTLLIASDEPWIPWELVRPFDNSDPTSPIDDDFLCLRFQLTRWLAGESNPPGLIQIGQLAFVGSGDSAAKLATVDKEAQLIEGLAGKPPEAAFHSLPKATFKQLKSLLKKGGLDLLHFAGHGDFSVAQPDESKILLADRPLRARNLSGPLAARLRMDRPFVFFNACRIARQGWVLTGLGGWVDAWLRNCGAGAFIGPMWTVRDSLAYGFADAFYRALAAGETVGEATRAARIVVRQMPLGWPAWLSYSVYAHPNARLALGSVPPPEAALKPSKRPI